MKALTYQKAEDEFRIVAQPIPQPGPDQVRVKVSAAGLNPVDAKINLWSGAVPAMDDAWVPGLDVSGIIDAIGSNVTRWSEGDAVLYHGDMFKPHGGFAEYAITDADTLIPHPNIEETTAAATPCAGWTAWRALVDKLRIQERSSLLVLGGAGGVGGFAIQIAKHFGVKTIIATCSEKNADYARSLGATHTVDYNSSDVVTMVMRLTDDQGVEVALDAVGGDNDIIAANALAFDGQMVEIVSTTRPKDYKDVFMRGLSFHQLALGAAHGNGPNAKAKLIKAGTSFTQLLETGKIKVPKLIVISLDEVGDTLKNIRSQRTVGKIVMKI